MRTFVALWNRLFRVQLPQSQREARDATGVWDSAWFPVVGLAAGIGLWLIAGFVDLLVPDRFAEAVLAALAVCGVFAWFVGLRRYRSVVAWSRAIAGRDESPEFVPVLVINAWALLLLLGVGGVVAQAGAAWLIMVPVIGFAAFAEIVTGAMPSSGADENPPLAVCAHWLAALAIGLVFAALTRWLIPVLFALLLGWALTVITERAGLLRDEPRGELRPWLVYTLVELLVIWVGVMAG